MAYRSKTNTAVHVYNLLCNEFYISLAIEHIFFGYISYINQIYNIKCRVASSKMPDTLSQLLGMWLPFWACVPVLYTQV